MKTNTTTGPGKEMKAPFSFVLLALLIAGSVATCNADVISLYQDNFTSSSEYASRYNTNYSATWWQPPWEYVSLGSGNMGVQPVYDSGNVGFSTKDYVNGHFTNTTYVMEIGFACPQNKSPELHVGLLNNGWGANGTGTQERYYGYDFMFQNSGSLAMGFYRYNLDGSSAALVPANVNGVDPLWWNVALDLPSKFFLTVDVQPNVTYLTATFYGVEFLDRVTPVSYSISYADTSAKRFTTGTGFGINGWAGGTTGYEYSGLTLDYISVNTIPEPASCVVLAGGLLSLLGVRRRRA
jgi:hypothetical protein